MEDDKMIPAAPGTTATIDGRVQPVVGWYVSAHLNTGELEVSAVTPWGVHGDHTEVAIGTQVHRRGE